MKNNESGSRANKRASAFLSQSNTNYATSLHSAHIAKNTRQHSGHFLSQGPLSSILAQDGMTDLNPLGISMVQPQTSNPSLSPNLSISFKPPGVQSDVSTHGLLSITLPVTENTSTGLRMFGGQGASSNIENEWFHRDEDRVTPKGQIPSSTKKILRVLSSFDLLRYLKRRDRFDEIMNKLGQLYDPEFERPSSEEYFRAFDGFQQEARSPDQENEDDSDKFNLKNLDLNQLSEIFEFLNGILSQSVCVAHQVSEWLAQKSVFVLDEMISHLFRIYQGICDNLDENEFEGLSTDQAQVIKLENAAKFCLNLSCYLIRYKSNEQLAQAYMQKSTESQLECIRLQKTVHQREDSAVTNEMTREHQYLVAINYNNLAVMYLQKENPTHALLLSKQSVKFLEQPIFTKNYLNFKDFAKDMKALLISYYNLGISYELMIEQHMASGSVDKVGPISKLPKKVFTHGLQIATQGISHFKQESQQSGFDSELDVLIQKIKFKALQSSQSSVAPRQGDKQGSNNPSTFAPTPAMQDSEAVSHDSVSKKGEQEVYSQCYTVPEEYPTQNAAGGHNIKESSIGRASSQSAQMVRQQSQENQPSQIGATQQLTQAIQSLQEQINELYKRQQSPTKTTQPQVYTSTSGGGYEEQKSKEDSYPDTLGGSFPSQHNMYPSGPYPPPYFEGYQHPQHMMPPYHPHQMYAQQPMQTAQHQQDLYGAGYPQQFPSGGPSQSGSQYGHPQQYYYNNQDQVLPGHPSGQGTPGQPGQQLSATTEHAQKQQPRKSTDYAGSRPTEPSGQEINLNDSQQNQMLYQKIQELQAKLEEARAPKLALPKKESQEKVEPPSATLPKPKSKHQKHARVRSDELDGLDEEEEGEGEEQEVEVRPMKKRREEEALAPQQPIAQGQQLVVRPKPSPAKVEESPKMLADDLPKMTKVDSLTQPKKGVIFSTEKGEQKDDKLVPTPTQNKAISSRFRIVDGKRMALPEEQAIPSSATTYAHHGVNGVNGLKDKAEEGNDTSTTESKIQFQNKAAGHQQHTLRMPHQSAGAGIDLNDKSDKDKPNTNRPQSNQKLIESTRKNEEEDPKEMGHKPLSMGNPVFTKAGIDSQTNTTERSGLDPQGISKPSAFRTNLQKNNLLLSSSASQQRMSGASEPVGSAGQKSSTNQNTSPQVTLNKINFSKDMIDTEQIMFQEHYFYNASNVFYNNGCEILKEIDFKRKIVLSKMVFSRGQYYKLTVIARSQNMAQIDNVVGQQIQSNMQGNTDASPSASLYTESKPGNKFPLSPTSSSRYQPVFQVTGQSSDPSVTFTPSTLHLQDLELIMRLLMVKDVLPPYKTLSHIRSIKDLCTYLIFPFMQVQMASDQNQVQQQRGGEGSSIDCSCSHQDISSVISHNVSNNSHQNNRNKTTVELWARAPGLFKSSVAYKFLGDYCNVGVHHIERRHFRISLISLDKGIGSLNQIVLDMTVDQGSFEALFKSMDVDSFVSSNPAAQMDFDANEINLESIEVLEQSFFDIIQPGLEEFQTILQRELGSDVSFDQAVLDQKGICFELRMSEADGEGSQPKLELWSIFDCQRSGKLRVSCQTLYQIKISKNVQEVVQRTLEVDYTEFNTLFGIKKHELDRVQLVMFGSKFLQTMQLFMPTMKYQKASDDDEYVEEIILQQKEINTLLFSRRILIPSLTTQVESEPFQVEPEKQKNNRNSNVSFANNKATIGNRPAVITIELLGIDDEDFLGVKVTQFNEKTLSTEGMFFFIDSGNWTLTEEDRKAYAPKKLEVRKIKKGHLIYHHWVVAMLAQVGFDLIFSKLKFQDQALQWECLSNEEDFKGEAVNVDLLDSYVSVDMIEKDKVSKYVPMNN